MTYQLVTKIRQTNCRWAVLVHESRMNGEGESQLTGESKLVSPPSDVAAALQEHLIWLSSKRQDGKQLDLTGRRLQRTDLSNLDLSSSLLRQANLARANLAGTTLAGADLQGADLRDCN